MGDCYYYLPTYGTKYLTDKQLCLKWLDRVRKGLYAFVLGFQDHIAGLYHQYSDILTVYSPVL